MNVAIKLSDTDVSAIRNGGECVAKAIAENAGCRDIQSMKMIDCGNFFRLFVEYGRYE